MGSPEKSQEDYPVSWRIPRRLLRSRKRFLTKTVSTDDFGPRLVPEKRTSIEKEEYPADDYPSPSSVASCCNRVNPPNPKRTSRLLSFRVSPGH